MERKKYINQGKYFPTLIWLCLINVLEVEYSFTNGASYIQLNRLLRIMPILIVYTRNIIIKMPECFDSLHGDKNAAKLHSNDANLIIFKQMCFIWHLQYFTNRIFSYTIMNAAALNWTCMGAMLILKLNYWLYSTTSTRRHNAFEMVSHMRIVV
jgi:hypothetical protein